MKKIEMTEEEAKQLISEYVGCCYLNVRDAQDSMLSQMKERGYIIKTWLEVLMEESDKSYEIFKMQYVNNNIDTSWADTVSCVIAQNRLIEEFKSRLKKGK